MALLEDNPRFDYIDDEELEMIRAGLVPKNTKKVKRNVKSACLKQKGKDKKFWLYEEAELDRVLGKFWFEAETKKGEKYTVSTLDI